MTNNESYASVPEFYAGKSVFITGGAGYLGKVLFEKLLYSCPDVDKVYILLRDKRNVTAEARLQNILDLPMFSRLRNERPEALNKIKLLKGDLCAYNLNMNAEDLKTVIEKVSIVIHSAAVIKFNDTLKVALDTNVGGTRNVLSLCRKMKKLQVYVHVSTAYCNAHLPELEEVVYPPPVSVEDAYRFAESNPDEAETMKFLGGRPNTYTFSKALAEHLVYTTHGDIPVVIVRPSIVTPSKEEPLKGWVDNWFGSTGLLTIIAKGVCRAVHTDENNILDVIPVDYVCNLTLVACSRAQKQSDVQVYNSCSGTSKPIRVKEMKNMYCDYAVQNNMNDLPYPHWVLLSPRYWLVWIITSLSYLVAYTADAFGRLSRKKPQYVKLVTQSVLMRSAMNFFTVNSWVMKTDRSTELFRSLSAEDAKTFPFLPSDIDWKEYVHSYAAGVKKYLLEKPATKAI